MMYFSCASRGRNPLDPTDRKTHSNGTFQQRLEVNWGGYSNTITSVAKDCWILEIYD